MSRHGFTLLELLVGLVLTGVVALLVYGATEAGVDSEARLAAQESRFQSERAMRTLLEDALRNARLAPRPTEPAFTLEPGTPPAGAPADRLTFVTRGGFPPLTADADWRVRVEVTPAGLAVAAMPLGVRGAPRLAGLLTGITGLAVRVQPPGGGAWTGRWPLRNVFPRAVEIIYRSDSGPVGPPLVVALPLGGAP